MPITVAIHDIRLRERGTKKVHVFTGSRKQVKKPKGAPAWMPDKIWKPVVKKGWNGETRRSRNHYSKGCRCQASQVGVSIVQANTDPKGFLKIIFLHT